jgi:hypothetical protein
VAPDHTALLYNLSLRGYTFSSQAKRFISSSKVLRVLPRPAELRGPSMGSDCLVSRKGSHCLQPSSPFPESLQPTSRLAVASGSGEKVQWSGEEVWMRVLRSRSRSPVCSASMLSLWRSIPPWRRLPLTSFDCVLWMRMRVARTSLGRPPQRLLHMRRPWCLWVCDYRCRHIAARGTRGLDPASRGPHRIATRRKTRRGGGMSRCLLMSRRRLAAVSTMRDVPPRRIKQLT